MNMHSWRGPLAAAVSLAIAFSASSSAQTPKPGTSFYTDDSKFGFKVKTPKDWEFIPPQPDDATLLGKYDPPINKWVELGGDGNPLYLHAWLLKFDRREKPEEPEPEPDDPKKPKVTVIKFSYEAESLEQWVKDRMGAEAQGSAANWRVETSKPVKVGNVSATEYVFLGEALYTADKIPVRAYALLYQLEPDLEVAYLFDGPGKDKEWRDYERSFRTMAESFKRVPVTTLATPGKKASTKNISKDPVADPAKLSPREKRLRELKDEMRRTPGWKLYETPNYLIISANQDEKFIEELKTRLEAIRAIYAKDYPLEKARSAREKRKPRTGDEPAGPEAESKPTDPDDEGDEDFDIEEYLDPDSGLDPLEVAKSCVVRICKDRDAYISYGGSPGSAGYWYNVHKELVLYDDRGGYYGRDFTWLVMNHEAFHQFIYYFYGNISPHSWYNEGTGDFYGGYEYEHGKFQLKKLQQRKETLQAMLSEERFVPLKELVRYTQQQYYGESKYKTDGLDHYAQGWSLVYFLRTGKGKAKGWNDAWNRILDIYLDTLGSTGKLDQAVDEAFKGVDWDALEASWLSYMG